MLITTKHCDAMQRGKYMPSFVVDKDFEKDLMSSQQPNFTFM